MTDPARACAEEIYGVFWGAINGERHKEMIVSEIMHRLSKHFPPSVPETCTWSEDEQGEGWRTECGHRYEFITDGPEENGAKYCCYCGKALISKALIAEAK